MARRRDAEAQGAVFTKLVIEFRHVRKVFGSGANAVCAVNHLSFACPKGAFWAFMGPSGAGKSTVLHLIAGLTPPTSGQILVEGTDLAEMTSGEAAALLRKRIGYILQTFSMLPFLTVEENVAMPLVLDGLKRSEIDARVRDVLATVDMAHRAGHYPTHLSGGEQQRVAIARAFAGEPKLLMADEPTGNLDGATGVEVAELMFRLNREHGTTLVLVTHDVTLAARCGRRLSLASGRLVGDERAVDVEAA